MLSFVLFVFKQWECSWILNEIRAEELPAAASTAKRGESLSFGTALRPINGEMPATLNAPFMFSGAKAFCQAGFINGGTSERTCNYFRGAYSITKCFMYSFFKNIEAA